MRFKHWVAIGALLAAGPGVQAQPGQRVAAVAAPAVAAAPAAPADPADPAVAVPAPVYASALAGYTLLAKDGGAPDKSWRAANAAVGGQNDHVGHAGQHAPAPTDKKAVPQPATPAPASAQQHPHR
ncbi:MULTISPECIES: hypothetical protein [Massilia]|uniref:Uncharacterized protein n=1 Tax=Massilia haematophila TaxID=457923 RepID=A0ABV7PGZ9_9BURK|nr:hypothetical protein [Massilia sp.]